MMLKKTAGQPQPHRSLNFCLARRRSLLFLFLFLLLLVPRPAPAASGVSSAAEIDYPPFSFVDDQGRADGFSVALLRAAMKAMDREVTFRTGPWEDVRRLLESGAIEALPLVARTPEREDRFDFTFPYMTLHGAIVVRDETVDIDSLEDLRGRQVAVMRDDNAEEFLRREERGINIFQTASFEDALADLSRGRHDAVVLQKLVALRLIRESGLTNLRIVDTPLEDFRQDFCFAVKEGDRQTLALLNEGLALVMADGTYRFLHARWFSSLQLPEKRRILIGGNYNYPPYEFLDATGRPTGFATELSRAIAKELGLDIEIRLGPWTEAMKNLEEGNIDVIQGMFYLPERDLTFDFSQSYMLNHYVTAMRKDADSHPARLEDLAGLRVVVQRGDAIHSVLQSKGLAEQVIAVESQADALRAVAEKAADCALVVRVSALHLLDTQGWTDLQLGGQPIYSAEYGYAVAHGKKALLAEFSEGLKVLEKNGEYRRIYKKWMEDDSDESSSLSETLRYSALIIIPLLLTVLGAFLWSWSLRRQVARKTAELGESEEKYRSFFENSMDAILLTSVDGDILSANAAACLMFACPEAELIGTGRKGLVDPGDPRLPKLLAERERHGKAQGEVTLIRKDGSRFDGEVTSVLFGDELGQTKTSMIIRDISERKRIETALRESKHRYHSLFESIHDAILVTDAERTIVECNRGFSDLFGYRLEEIRGQQTSLIYETVEDYQRVGESLRNHENFPVALHTLRYRKKTGELFPGEISIYHLCDAEGNIQGLIGLIRDVSRRVQAEEGREQAEAQLRQAQKLESIGRLAGGVAHDFNNMLGVIIGYTQMAMDRLEPENQLTEDLQEVLKAAHRSKEIARQLLTFARKQNINPELLDLNRAVGNMVKMLRHMIGEDIELLWHPGPLALPVRIDPTQVDQILANLCVNARDAINGTGKVTIRTAHVTFNETYCAFYPDFMPGDYVLLGVSDDGCGMEKDLLENIFEPFFTTKESGRGTGLGLPMIYGIVKQNNGFVNVYSEPENGTTINVYLPSQAAK